MSPELITQIALMVIPIVIAVTFHEAAHGYVALHFGDRTAKEAGRVTLNPINHIDLFGTIILPLVLFLTAGFIFGYAKPVPVNFAALRNPRWDMVWVAAAGPGMNFALAMISAVLIHGAATFDGENAALVGNLLLRSVELNILLAVFNMLPLPPLDGSKVLAAFLPQTLAEPYLNFGRYGMTVLLLLIFIVPILAAQAGSSFDLFGPLVIVPADFLTGWLLRIFGMEP